MSAFLVTNVTAQNLDWVSEYLFKVPPIVHSLGGKFVAVSKGIPSAVELVEGSVPAPQAIAIIMFPSMNALKSFLESPEYAPYKEARMAVTESNFYAFENDDNAAQFIGQ